jgi:hypothetical protein
MKKLIVLTCLVATVSVVPLARAGTIVITFDRDYEGRVERDSNTWFGFDVDNVNGHKKARHIQFYVPMACRGDGQFRLLAGVEGAFRVRHHRFHGTGDLRFVKGGGEATVTGRLRRHGRARGTVDVTTPGDSDCYSGVLEWRARRGADVPPPP